MQNRIPTRMADILVGLSLFLLVGALTVDAERTAGDRSSKVKCASNLHQIGLGILLYQNENLQWYPRTNIDSSDDPKPTWGTPYEADKKLGPEDGASSFIAGKAEPADNDVTAALFLLLRNESIATSAFVCPSVKIAPWDLGEGARGTVSSWTNWQGNDGLAKHLSYSYQNPYPSKMAISRGFQLKNPDATFAIAADMNPGSDAVTKVTIRSGIGDTQAADSLNHGGDGQNVLFGDGHVEYQQTPFCGTQHDNIYTACGPEIAELVRKTAVILASPCGPTDSILLPTASDIGFQGPPPAKPLSDDQLAQLEADFQGTYKAILPGHGHRVAILTVDAKTLRCVSGPMTALYNYDVIGTQDGEILLHLTAPQTDLDATASLDGPDLKIDMTGDFSLNFPWHRVEVRTSSTRP